MVSATGVGFVKDKRLLFEATVLEMERLLFSAETELERRLGSLLEGDEGPVRGGERGDRAVAELLVLVGVLLLDTGDQVSG